MGRGDCEVSVCGNIGWLRKGRWAHRCISARTTFSVERLPGVSRVLDKSTPAVPWTGKTSIDPQSGKANGRPK